MCVCVCVIAEGYWVSGTNPGCPSGFDSSELYRLTFSSRFAMTRKDWGIGGRMLAHLTADGGQKREQKRERGGKKNSYRHSKTHPSSGRSSGKKQTRWTRRPYNLQPADSWPNTPNRDNKTLKRDRGVTRGADVQINSTCWIKIDTSKDSWATFAHIGCCFSAANERKLVSKAVIMTVLP